LEKSTGLHFFANELGKNQAHREILFYDAIQPRKLEALLKKSTHRILTTHSGSLVRTREIIEGMKAKLVGQPYDDGILAADIRNGVKQVVDQQIETGLDIVGDGEYGRPGFQSYVHELLTGFEPRKLAEGEDVWGSIGGPERAAFPAFHKQYDSHYRYLWMLPEVSMDDVPNLPGDFERFNVTGPIRYTGQEFIKTQIDNFKTALEAQGKDPKDAFIPSTTPTARKGDQGILNVFPSEEAFQYALADALHEEYKAITDAGFILQLDSPNTHSPRSLVGRRNVTEKDVNKAVELGVEVLNYSVRDIPEGQIRLHHCWGSMNTPHTQDVPLKNFVDMMLKIKCQAYAVEAANPRHEHEWMVWQDVKLPDGKILIPGVISQSTNVVEHPELVAWRIKNFASVVGKENVIASVDCGFSQWWDSIRVHPTVQWAKLRSLVEGAELASKELWGR
jgi:5-methyltetrahydropteroyltriglutamate--homocysteine methyltransferase